LERGGCADCHVEGRTDRSQHAVLDFGVATDTPTLQGIGATAPYLHDGSAPTLRDVLLRAGDGSMGDTSGLTEAELDALVAYLERL
jgi:cytochrome c peroxidase